MRPSAGIQKAGKTGDPVDQGSPCRNTGGRERQAVNPRDYFGVQEESDGSHHGPGIVVGGLGRAGQGRAEAWSGWPPAMPPS